MPCAALAEGFNFRGRKVALLQAICRLREVRLLDAAHIVGDVEEARDPVISNGLSLCSIHHPPSTRTSSASPRISASTSPAV